MPSLPADIDSTFMRRAIRLAMNGRGHVEPNPMVGCVIVRDGRVIGEGFHERFGGPHAEPNALANCTEPPAGATAYVTLEPCCHTNKKTPPCAPRLVEAKIARVVVGCLDPNPDVNGKGLAMLRAAGIEVAGPVLESEAKQLIAPFLYQVRSHNPYITLKWAESADGRVAGPGGRRMQISGPESAKRVHELRARSDGILIGIGTALADDPMLTPRNVQVREKPVRIVLDRQLRLPLSSQLVRTARDWPTVVICDERATDMRRYQALTEAGVNVLSRETYPSHNDRVDWADTLDEILRDELALREVLVEAGPTLARAALASKRVDRVWVFRSPVLVGDPTAPVAPTIPETFTRTGTLQVGVDELSEYQPPAPAEGGTLFVPVPTADFVLASP